MYRRTYAFIFLFLGLVFYIFTYKNSDADQNIQTDQNSAVSGHRIPWPQISASLQKNAKKYSLGNWPGKIRFDDQIFDLNYTFNGQLTQFINRLLSRYKSYFTSVVVIDNNNGHILSIVNRGRKEGVINDYEAFRVTHPAASLFKVITMAALLEDQLIDKDDIFYYRGRSNTLYKYQLNRNFLDSNGRYLRSVTLEDAFARSNNVIFGGLAQNYIDAKELIKFAENFWPTNLLLKHLPIDPAKIMQAHLGSDYQLAELASGFNRQTLISPIHAAAMASVVANDGQFKTLHVMNSIFDFYSGHKIWEANEDSSKVLTEETANKLQNAMKKVVTNGTARRSFRRFDQKNLGINLEVGGKTGSITGGLPEGKRDWFIAYARPEDRKLGNGISLCVMIVNNKRWYVKSTQLAKEVMKYYYQEVFKGSLDGQFLVQTN